MDGAHGSTSCIVEVGNTDGHPSGDATMLSLHMPRLSKRYATEGYYRCYNLSSGTCSQRLSCLSRRRHPEAIRCDVVAAGKNAVQVASARHIIHPGTTVALAARFACHMDSTKILQTILCGHRQTTVPRSVCLAAGMAA
jgi:hypothetical protein